MTRTAETIVKSCPRIESGLRLGPEAVKACCFSIIQSPEYWNSSEIPTKITKDDIIEKRKELFEKLNDDVSDISCKNCAKVETKKYKDVNFEKLGFVDLAHYSFCNLRCDYCGFTQQNNFHKAKYNALDLLSVFSSDDVQFDASVDFNGGEPSLLKNIKDYLDFLRTRNIRTRLYTNAVKYSEEIAEALADGTITWLIISVDAGTPETFYRTKLRNNYVQVVENIKRYKAACISKQSGRIAAKYIFTDENSDSRDVQGFVSDMVEAKPDQIWLLHDFLDVNQSHSKDLSAQNQAYAEMYTSFIKHGVLPKHFNESFLSQVKSESDELIRDVQQRIKKIISEENLKISEITRFPDLTISPAQMAKKIENEKHLNFAIAPAGLASAELLDLVKDNKNIACLFDISSTKISKKLRGVEIKHYDEFSSQEIDVLVVTSNYHYHSIISELPESRKVQNIKIVLSSSTAHQSL